MMPKKVKRRKPIQTVSE